MDVAYLETLKEEHDALIKRATTGAPNAAELVTVAGLLTEEINRVNGTTEPVPAKARERPVPVERSHNVLLADHRRGVRPPVADRRRCPIPEAREPAFLPPRNGCA